MIITLEVRKHCGHDEDKRFDFDFLETILSYENAYKSWRRGKSMSKCKNCTRAYVEAQKLRNKTPTV